MAFFLTLCYSYGRSPTNHNSTACNPSNTADSDDMDDHTNGKATISQPIAMN